MKRMWSNVRRIAVIASVAIVAVTFVGCDKDDDDDNKTTTYNVSGNSSGSQVVPSVTGTATGSLSGTYNDSSNLLVYTVNYVNLTTPPTSGGFYTGASGSNGSLAGSAFVLGSTPGVNGSVSGQMTLTADQETKLKSGNYYYVLSTTTNASGEIRGQVTATATN
jgi:hypothetical protein